MSRERDFLGLWYKNIELWNIYMEKTRDKTQTEQDPDPKGVEAWILHNRDTGYKRQIATKPVEDCALFENEAWEVIPLYTAPPRREPLGKEIKVPCGTTEYMFGFKDGVLYAEKHHGIGGGK